MNLLEKGVVTALAALFVFGGAWVINRLGFLSRRNGAWKALAIVAIPVYLAPFLMLTLIVRDPFLVEVGVERGRAASYQVLRAPFKTSFRMRQLELEPHRLAAVDGKGRHYAAPLPSRLGADGRGRTYLVPEKRFLWGWFYGMLKINERSFVNASWLRLFIAFSSVVAVLYVYVAGVEGRRANVKLESY